jgi:ankyrin repeat protein
MTDSLRVAARYCQRNNDALLQALVPSKVNPNTPVTSIHVNSIPRKSIPLICVAAGSGSLESLKLLMKSGAKIDATDDCGWTAFHWAASAGHAPILIFLVENGGKSILSRDSTPLLLAARYGRQDCVAYLLASGTNPACTDTAGRTPLHLASWFGHHDIARALIAAGAPIDQPDSSGKTPLHCAAWFGNRGVELVLLEKKVPLNAQDQGGDTPLHLACAHNRTEIVADLLKAGADTKVRNGLQKTPEEVAEEADRGEIVELLQQRDDSTHTALLGLDKSIIHDQRMMNKTLDELIRSQEKQVKDVRELRGKAEKHSASLQRLQAQDNELVRELEHIAVALKAITEKVDLLIPKGAAKTVFQVVRQAHPA